MGSPEHAAVAARDSQGWRPQTRHVLFTENADDETVLSKASPPYPSIGVLPTRMQPTSLAGSDDAPSEVTSEGTGHVWLLASSSRGRKQQIGGVAAHDHSPALSFPVPPHSLLGGSSPHPPPAPHPGRTPRDEARPPYRVPLTAISQAGVREDQSN